MSIIHPQGCYFCPSANSSAKSVYKIALLYENYENNYSFLRLIPV